MKHEYTTTTHVDTAHGYRRFIHDDTGRVIVTFHEQGSVLAYELFKVGLSLVTSATLRDEDTGEYLIGSIDQLFGG